MWAAARFLKSADIPMACERHTPEFVREALRYAPDTGRLTWRARPNHHFMSKRAHSTWNTRFAGIEAFTVVRETYLSGELNRRTYPAHRVIWAIVHGVWPTGEVDHKNGIRTDNRLENLRLCTSQENAWNRRACGGAVGLKGVYLRESGKYRAQIHSQGRFFHLGTFETPEEAHAAYCAAANTMFGEFARFE
jgi:hypothetical protein